MIDHRSPNSYDFEVKKWAVGGVDVEIERENETQQSTTPSEFAEGLHRKARVWCCRAGRLHWLPCPLLST